MPHVVQTTFLDVDVSVTRETKTPRNDAGEPGDPIEFVVLTFVDRSPTGDVRIVKVPLDPNAVAVVARDLTGGGIQFATPADIARANLARAKAHR